MERESVFKLHQGAREVRRRYGYSDIQNFHRAEVWGLVFEGIGFMV